MTTLTIGIDPGKLGAIAALDEHGALVDVIDMPNAGGEVSAALLADALDAWCDGWTRIGTVVVASARTRQARAAASARIAAVSRRSFNHRRAATRTWSLRERAVWTFLPASPQRSTRKLSMAV